MPVKQVELTKSLGLNITVNIFPTLHSLLSSWSGRTNFRPSEFRSSKNYCSISKQILKSHPTKLRVSHAMAAKDRKVGDGGGVHIHIFVFTDFKNNINRFQKQRHHLLILRQKQTFTYTLSGNSSAVEYH